MPSRISFTSFYSNMRNDLTQFALDLQRINRQISSGKRVQRPSDDPVAMATILGRRRNLEAIKQYERNLQMADVWLKTSNSALESANDILARARTLAEEMATGTFTAQNRATAAEEIDTLIANILNLGNTKIGDTHVFAGQRILTTAFRESFYINKPRPDSSNASSYCGVIASSGTYYHGHASGQTGSVANDNALYYFAQDEGTDGNGIAVVLSDPGAVSQPLSVSVNNKVITVSLATDGTGAITSTAADVKAAIEASTPASALVAVELADGSTGGGTVSAETATFSGGTVAQSRKYVIEITTAGAAGPATLDTAIAGADNDLRFTAATTDGSGDSISITYVDPGAPSQPLSVSVDGRRIVVSLATDGGGAITSTAAQVMAAINADSDASALVSAALAPDNDGTGVVAAMSETNLAYNGRQADLDTALSGADNDFVVTANAFGTSGNNITLTLSDPGAPSQPLSVTVAGNDITVSLATNAQGVITSTASDVVSALNSSAAASALVSAALAPGNDGTGVVTAMSQTNLSGGAAQAKFRVGEYYNGTTTWGADDTYACDTSAVQIFDESNGQYFGVKIAFGENDNNLLVGDKFYVDAGYYRGDETALYTTIGSADRIQHNATGTEFLGGAGDTDNILDLLRQFKEYLLTDDQDGVQNMIEKLETARNSVVDLSASFGARINRLEIRTNINAAFSLTAVDHLAEIESVDIADAMTELSMVEIGYQAALASISQIASLSLVNYM